jgi:DNA-binding MarR family transcriptional regulator
MAKTHLGSEELLKPTIDEFWETFPTLWHSIRARIRKVATEEFDITVEQFHILRRIHKGSDSVSKLAEAKQISRPAVSRVVDVMVNKGLVSRTQDPSDRRYVRLSLTTEGSALLEAIFGRNRDWMAEKLASLEIDELKTIRVAMMALSKAFN